MAGGRSRDQLEGGGDSETDRFDPLVTEGPAASRSVGPEATGTTTSR